jgi:hypothetical protein
VFGKGKKKRFQKKSTRTGDTGMKKCVLYDRDCIECGECDRCDLDPDKICDNCMKCVNGDDEYRSILIDKVILPEENNKDSH